MASPLDTQVVNLPIAAGVQELADERILDLPFMATIQNGVFRKDGSITKRYGSTAVVSTGLPSTLDPNCGFDHNGAAVQHTPHGTYSLSEDNTRWRLVTPAATRATGLISREITREGNTHHHECAVIGNMVCHVWQQVDAADPGVWATVIELDTGAVIMVPTKLPSTIAHMPRVVAFDSTFIIAGHSSTTLPSPVYATRIPTTTIPVAVTGGNVRIDNSTDIARFDCHAETTDSAAHFAFSSAANTYIAAYNKSLTLVDSDTLAKDSDTALACYYNATVSTFFVATRAGDTANVLVHSIAFVAGAYGAPALDVFSRAPADVDVNDPDLGLIIGPLGSTGTMFMGSCTNELAAASIDQKRHIRFWSLTTTGAYAASSEFTITGYELATKWVRPTNWEYPVFGVVSVNFDSTPTGLLVTPYAVTYGSGQEALSVTSLAVIARFHQEIITDHLAMGRDIDVPLNTANVERKFPRIVPWSTDQYIFSQTVVSQFLTANDGERFGDRTRKAGNYALFTVTPPPLHQGKCNGLSVFDGGMCSGYDGLLAFENTPHQAPYVVQSVGVGTLDAGDYSYAYYFYFEDNNGNIHRGPVHYSEPVSVSGDDDKIVHTLVAWPLSALDGQHHRRMKMAIYRTTDGGTTYYLIKDNISSLDAAYEDQTEDATLELNPQLYTTGDVLESGPAPSLLDMITAKGRAFGISGELPNTLWYTKPFEPSVAPEWAPENTIHIPDEGGEVVAIGSLDDKVIVFKERSIYYFFGEGPNGLGQDGDFSDIRPISVDVGCTNKKTVISGPFGILFQGHARGFYIIGRDLSVTHVGNVEDTLADQTVNSATLVPIYREVRFTTNGSEALVFNYLFNRWSTFTVYPGVHSFMWDDIFCRVQDDYDLLKEDSSSYTEDSTGAATGYRFTLVTPWIKIAGLQGFKRIRRVAFLGAHGGQYFKAEVGYNYEGAYPISKNWSPSELDALDRFQPSIHLAIQKCESIRFRISDTNFQLVPGEGESFVLEETTPTGAGYTLAGLALTVGIKKGIFKHLPDGAKK